jgi:uncharacterized OB-fold protein
MVALVELEEGPLLAAQLTDVEGNEVHIGNGRADGHRVGWETTAPRGTVLYGYKFRPEPVAGAAEAPTNRR